MSDETNSTCEDCGARYKLPEVDPDCEVRHVCGGIVVRDEDEAEAEKARHEAYLNEHVTWILSHVGISIQVSGVRRNADRVKEAMARGLFNDGELERLLKAQEELAKAQDEIKQLMSAKAEEPALKLLHELRIRRTHQSDGTKVTEHGDVLPIVLAEWERREAL